MKLVSLEKQKKKYTFNIPLYEVHSAISYMMLYIKITATQQETPTAFMRVRL